MNLRKSLSAALAVFVMQIGSVHAALFSYEFTGTVSFAEPSNNFGLSLSDTVTASGIFNDDVLDNNGSGIIEFGGTAPASNTISIQMSDSISFDTGSLVVIPAQLELSSGAVSMFGIAASDASGAFNSNVAGDGGLAAVFIANDSFNNIVRGDWNSTFSTSPVPVPAAVWLFGSGLIGLVGIARRKPR